MNTGTIIMMALILTFFFGGFIALIIRLQMISKDQNCEK